MLLLAAAAATPGTADRPVDYVVEPGDTLSQLSERYILPEYGWRKLMDLTSIPNPRRLPVGLVIALPRPWLKFVPEQASLASVRGTVSLSVNGRAVTPSVGTVLGEGAVITTSKSSFVTLLLSNGSRVSLPSQSRVNVALLRKYVINGALDYRFTLGGGRIDTTVTPLSDPSGNFIINTPLAMTAVRGTDYGVAFDQDQQAAGTEVFSGAVAVSRPDGSVPLLIPEAYGATTDATGESRKVKLLDAPDLVDPGRVQTDDLVTLEITPVPDAVGYRMTLATDAGFVDRYAEQTAQTPHFAIENVPNGNQFVRISALASNGLEGLRASYAFMRRLASVHAEAASTPEGYRFKWFGSGEGERHYRLQIFRETLERAPVVDEVGLIQSEALVQGLAPGVYLWRVAVAQTDSQGLIEIWTNPEKLTIAAPSGG